MAPDDPVSAGSETTDAESAAAKKDSQTGFAGLIEGPLALAAAITAVLASTVGLLYVIGGTVMWLRFHEANLPADRAVALVPKNDLLILGLRVMVIPALLSGGFLLLLGSIWRAREMHLAELVKERAELAKSAEADPERVEQLAHEIERGKQPLLTTERLPRPRTHPVRFAILVVLAFGLVLVVPFSAGALVWPLVLVGLLVYWLRLRPPELSADGTEFPIWRLAVAAMIGAATISIARQTDRPVELPSVRADVRNPSALVAQTFELQADGERGRVLSRGQIAGLLVAVRSKELAIGDPTDGVITTLPRSSVTSMAIGPAPDQRGPPTSLLSRIVRGRGWSVTPLELWCANLRYGWDRIGHACGLEPQIEVDDTLAIRNNRVRGIEVLCPKGAEDGCRGFILMRSREPVAVGARLQRLAFGPESFVIDAGGRSPVLLTVSQRKLFEQLREHPKSRADEELPVRILLTTEAEGEAVVKRAAVTLLVAAPPKKKTDKKQPAKKGSKKRKDRKGTTRTTTHTTTTTTTTSGAGRTGRQPTGDDGEPASTASPAPTATEEVAPENTDPLPPQEDTLPAPTPPPDEPAP